MDTARRGGGGGNNHRAHAKCSKTKKNRIKFRNAPLVALRLAHACRRTRAGAYVGKKKQQVRNEGMGKRAVGGGVCLHPRCNTYLVLADVGFIKQGFERARGEGSKRSLWCEMGVGKRDGWVSELCFLSRRQRRSDVFVAFLRKRGDVAGDASVFLWCVMTNRRVVRVGRLLTLLISASACC